MARRRCHLQLNMVMKVTARTGQWFPAMRGLRVYINGVQPSETFEFTSTSSFAVDYGYEAVVKLLLARVELDVNSKDPAGQTLLSCAASMGNSEMVKLLLTRDDLDVSSRTSKRQTPLLLAADKGRWNCYETRE